MKTPYRYLIGIAAGLLAGLFLPADNGILSTLGIASEISLRIGRYIILPLMFFSLPVAITRLRREGILGSLLLNAGLYALFSAAALTVLGTLIAWLTGFGRIPVIPGTPLDADVVSLGTMIRNILTFNGFRSLIGDSSFILPILVPAFLLGWHFHHDREIAEPAYNLFDSLSRILYRINRYILSLMPLMIAILSAQAVLQIRGVVDFQRFLPMIGVLLAVCVVLIGAVYPLILRLSCGHRSPWKDLAGLSGAFLGAMVSGSPLFNYGNLIRHLKENLNVPRKTAALLTPLYLMFSRGGTALISAFAMLTVIRSYSSLEITLFQAAWTALFVFLISFALPATPDRGLAASLVMLGALYGRGLDDGWLILVPALPVLYMVAALLDSATGAMMILILTRRIASREDDAVTAVRF